MIKKGFTLQEVLITLGIIGIVAAVTAPGLSRIFPDRDKATYMKIYRTITTQVDDILGDDTLYWPDTTCSSNGGNGDACLGLMNNLRPNVAPYNDNNNNPYSSAIGGHKFGLILASRLNLSTDPEITGANNSTETFTTTDGTNWETQWLQTSMNSRHVACSNYRTNGQPENINKCAFEVITVRYGRQTNGQYEFNHQFFVDNFGKIIAADVEGQAYLANPTDMHSGKEDRANASNYTDKSNLVDTTKHPESFIYPNPNEESTEAK